MRLCVICISFHGIFFFVSFAHFVLLGLFDFILLIYTYYLYILEIKFFVNFTVTVFFHFVTCPFIIFMVTLDEQVIFFLR